MEKEKAQLHQLLAVETDRKQKAAQILNESAATFSKKQEFFDGLIKTYKNFEEDGDKMPSEVKEIVTTVRQKLDYTAQSVVRAIDAQVSKEETNASGEARAELRVQGVEFGELSATSLLNLQSHLERVRNLYQMIPTLDLTRAWRPDNESGPDYWRTDPEYRYRSIKRAEPITLASATPEHAAQVQLVNTDVQVGEWSTVHKSGRITTAQKSDMLQNIDDLVDAVKRARARANKADVVDVKIGKRIFNYIHDVV